MDTALVMSVLEEALMLYGKPEIFKGTSKNHFLNAALRRLRLQLQADAHDGSPETIVFRPIGSKRLVRVFRGALNTDQGSQYTSYIHTERLKSLGVSISMNGAGRSIGNICIERFWRSAKVEKIYLNEYDRVSTLKEDVRE